MVCHLKNAADIGRLRLVEEDSGFFRVRVDPVLAALDEFQGDERVEKIPGATGMKAEATGERLEVLGVFRQLGEEFHLDGTQQSLGGPEGETGSEDVFGIGCGVVGHACG